MEIVLPDTLPPDVMTRDTRWIADSVSTLVMTLTVYDPAEGVAIETCSTYKGQCVRGTARIHRSHRDMIQGVLQTYIIQLIACLAVAVVDGVVRVTGDDQVDIV